MILSGSSNSRYPFTASQWQELEHQTLIFKYMASGIPIPPDLIISIKRSFLDPTADSTSLFCPSHLQLGWNCCRTGYGKKAEDPEPGRCRRTDGKKWRCSKVAYPDSKYCERHMHRGKNRSRKPVEISPAAKSIHSSSSSSSTQMSPCSSNLSLSTFDTCHHVCPYSSSSGTAHFPFDAATFFDGEHMHGAERGSSLEFRTPRMNSMAEAKQSNYFLSKEEEEERQRPLRHFLDECPERNRDPWTDLEVESSSYTKTQLSISLPK